MKKILILGLFSLLAACRPSLTCESCIDYLKQSKCPGDSVRTTVAIKDSTISADSVKVSSKAEPNKDVVNAALNVFTICDSVVIRYVEQSTDSRETKEKVQERYREGKMILGKNIDNKCPEYKTQRVDMDNYYAIVSYPAGVQTLNIYRSPHNIALTTITEEPLKLYDRPATDDWYFWGFWILAVFIAIEIIFVLYSKYIKKSV